MKYTLYILLLAFSFAGCSSTNSLKDYSNNPNAMWEEGKKLSEKGEKLIIKGEDKIESAQINENKGEALITSGSDAIVRIRNEYQVEAAKIGGSASPKEVEFEAERLNAISEKWAKAISNVKKGNDMVIDAKSLRTEGQKQVTEGRTLVDKGSNFIRNSQRMRLEQPLLGQ